MEITTCKEAIELVAVSLSVTTAVGFATYWLLKHKLREDFAKAPKEEDGEYVTMQCLIHHCESNKSTCQKNFCRKIDDIKIQMEKSQRTVLRGYSELTRKYESSIKDIYEENKKDREKQSEDMKLIHGQLGHLAGIIEERAKQWREQGK